MSPQSFLRFDRYDRGAEAPVLLTAWGPVSKLSMPPLKTHRVHKTDPIPRRKAGRSHLYLDWLTGVPYLCPARRTFPATAALLVP